MKEMPKYKIIENYIIDRIQSGDLKPGDQIETEKQLSEKFDIGRLTVNKALINLAQEGYIERTAGVRAAADGDQKHQSGRQLYRRYGIGRHESRLTADRIQGL